MSENEKKPWHAMEQEEVLKQVDSSPEGLKQDQASKRREEFGPNSLEAEEGVSPFRILIRQINTPLIYLLIAAAVVSLIAGKTVDAGVIAGVVILNTLLGFFQEWRAEGALKALREMSAPHAQVLRDGQEQDIEANDVVPGDILVLQSGDRVAADARLLEINDLQVDESALTGESEPVAKETERLEENTSMGDRRNMVWMSTSVTGGQGKAVVVETGMETEMGNIAGEVRSTRREKTPLQNRMHKLGIMLGVIGIVLAGAVFGLGLLRGYETVDMLLFSVAVAVSAIPEGLPAVITVTLALGVRRMAKRNAIIRRLPAVETLGSTTVICSDKTGTLTENQMTVQKIWADGKIFKMTGEGYQPEGEIHNEEDQPVDEKPEALEKLLWIGALSNDSHVKQHEQRWQVDGDPSEGALLVAAQKAGFEPDALREETERLHEVPFSSDRKYMATLHTHKDGQGQIVLVKGAPDRLLEFCSHILIEGERVDLDEKRREEVSRMNEEFAANALRVMAGGYREFSESKNKIESQDVEQDLTLVGLWGMIDPPREESSKAVEAAKGAGIRPVMITGDYAATALAIARQIGITEEDKVLSAKEVDEMDKAQLAEATMQSGVFARVSPSHKLKITEALREHGQVVAMTGDGVNDAPALKGADIGVAMGQAGTEVAKEAADMILTDDNFATIVYAVEEGRVIYNNLRRVVFFLLATNLGEILTLVGALAIGLDLPLTAVMILWVNLVTDGACTVPLGIEPHHRNVLKQPPRDPQEPIVDWTIIRRLLILTPIMAVGTLGLFWYVQQEGSFAHAQTVAFTTLAAFQWFQSFNARSQYQSIFSIGFFSNRWLLLGLSIAIVLQIIVVHTPLGHNLFKTTHLTGWDWLLIILVTSTIWIADEILKWFGVHGKPSERKEEQK